MGWLFFRGYGSGGGLAFAGRNHSKALGDLILGIYSEWPSSPFSLSAIPGDRIIFGAACSPPYVI